MNETREQMVAALFESMTALKRVMSVRMQETDASCPLPRAQADMLVTIGQLEPVSSKRLAANLYLTPGAISQQLEGLESHQLVLRQTDETDRRKQFLTLSNKGKHALEEMSKHRRTILQSIVSGLTDEELHVWLRVQRKMLEHMQQEQTK